MRFSTECSPLRPMAIQKNWYLIGKQEFLLSVQSSQGVYIQSNHLNISNNGFIGSLASGGGKGGDIRVKTDNLLIIDDNDKTFLTGITARTPKPNTSSSKTIHGKGGSVFVSANSVELLNGGEISTRTRNEAHGGNIQVTANDVKINGKGSAIKAYTNGVGDAGNLILNVKGNLNVQNQGQIHAATFKEGHGGNVRVTANNINIKGTGAVDVDSDGIKDFTGISAGTDYSEVGSADRVHNAGDAGSVTITANSNLSITNSGEITALTRDKGNGGNVKVTAKNINIEGDRSAITASTISFGNAGNVTIKASDKLSIKNGAQINAATFAEGNGGNVDVTAKNIDIDVEGNKLFTGISTGTDYSNDGIAENTSNAGNAGNISITANGNLSIKDGGQISTLTRDKGNGGNVQVTAKNIDIMGSKSAITATTESAGNAGNVMIKAFDGLTINDGGAISVRTSSVGKAGNINVWANALKLDSLGRGRTGMFADTLIEGRAGNITITTRSLDIFNDFSLISTSTSGKGGAGDITINADKINIDGIRSLPVGDRDLPGIESSARDGSSGNGGNIKIGARKIELSNGGSISTSTHSIGSAGSVSINTDEMVINTGAVVSSASIGTKSSGRTGNIEILAKDWLKLASGSIQLINESTDLDAKIAASITPGTISINAHDIQLTNSIITSESLGNIAAGEINLRFIGTLFLDPSFITTNANQGNGGAINIHGGEMIRLQNSSISTSVKGATGNGGNITISSDSLIMETGLIQANTAAEGGSGGDIQLNLKSLITSGNMLTLGGSKQAFWKPGVFGLNVIQAAAPNGLSGQIQSSAPQLNLSGELSNLGAPQFDTGFLSQEYCSLGSGSSLRRLGKGGILPKGRDAWVY